MELAKRKSKTIKAVTKKKKMGAAMTEALAIQARIDKKFGKAEMVPMPIKHVKKIYIYTGGMARLSVSGICYDKGVPTFVNVSHREELNGMVKTGNFEIYMPDRTYAMPKSRSILIQMPLRRDYVIAALQMFYYIKMHYPLSPVTVMGGKEYAKLMPGSTFLDYLQGQQNYYRTFDLRDGKLDRLFTKASLSIMSSSEILIRKSGFLDSAHELYMPNVMENTDYTEDAIILYDKKQTDEKLVEALEGLAEIKCIEDYKWQDLLKYKSIVCMFDRVDALMFLQSDRRVLGFISNDVFNRKLQYAKYKKGLVYPHPAVKQYDKAREIIGKWIDDGK